MKHNQIELENCPLCGHAHFAQKRTVKDFSTSQELFQICECDNCQLLFTNPRPSDDAIGSYYESNKYISHTNQSEGLFGKAYQVLRKRALAKKLSWISKFSKTGNLIDYGCGTGEFLNFCKQNGWQVSGFEIAEAPRKMAISNYQLDVKSPSEFENVGANSQDVISLWHVLEHLPNLNETVAKLVSKIKPGGQLVLALPNADSWDAKHYEEFWAAWDVPIHFYHFKKNNIEMLAKNNGLELVETINMPYDAYYVSLLSEEYKTGKKNWLKASLNGFKSNKAAGKDNASSLTYILRKL